MKRCPECRRDYYDDTLAFCLEDGNALIQGSVPAPVESSDGPMTAILHETAPPSDPVTLAHTRTTEQTAVFQSGISEQPKKGFDKRFLLAPIALAIITLGAFAAYRYLTPAQQIQSIAVMPFVNESGNPELEYLSDGMTETLIKSLSNLQELDVKPRSAVFRYKGNETDLPTIGKELNVQAVLNGRVVRRGDQLTLSLELVDVQKNRVIWTERYERRQSELVELQSEIAKDVSSRLSPRLSSAEETKIMKAASADPEAYQAYLRGRYFWNRRTSENIQKAIEQFTTATSRDPNYALAYAGLGDCYTVLAEYSGLPSSETAPKAKVFAERAIALDSQLAEPHATLGSVLRQLWQWNDAEKEYKRAIELNPNYPTAHHWYSIMLKEMGKKDEAATVIKRARELDPLSSVIGVNLAELYQDQNNHAAAIEICLKVIELDPNYPSAYEDLSISYAIVGRKAEAVAAGEKSAELSKRAGVTLGSLGFVYAAAGDRPKALSVIKELEEKYERKESIGFDIASVYAGLGDNDKAFEWLERDYRTRNGKLGSIRYTTTLEQLRSDGRFNDLLKRMDLL
jgi:TolB-like protein/Flp pilus assembly protein TadD